MKYEEPSMETISIEEIGTDITLRSEGYGGQFDSLEGELPSL